MDACKAIATDPDHPEALREMAMRWVQEAEERYLELLKPPKRLDKAR